MILIIPFKAEECQAGEVLEAMLDVAGQIQRAQETRQAHGQEFPVGAEVIDVDIDTRQYYYGIVTGSIKLQVPDPSYSS